MSTDELEEKKLRVRKRDTETDRSEERDQGSLAGNYIDIRGRQFGLKCWTFIRVYCVALTF